MPGLLRNSLPKATCRVEWTHGTLVHVVDRKATRSMVLLPQTRLRRFRESSGILQAQPCFWSTIPSACDNLEKQTQTLTAPEHMAAAPQLESSVMYTYSNEHGQNIPDTKTGDINVCRKYFPEHVRPFKQDVADVKCVQDPRPLVAVEMQSFVCTCRLCISNIASVEVREDIEDAHDWQDTTVKLETCQPNGRLLQQSS